MTNDEIKKIDEVIDGLKVLEKFLDERVVDFYEVKGMMQARHTYIFYRKHVWDAMYALRDIINESTEPKD